MQKIAQHILFATDFSACATNALQHAWAWASFFQSDLTIVHVVGTYAGMDIEEAIVQVYIDEQKQRACKKLEDLVVESKRHVPDVQSRLMPGVPTEQICEAALDSKVDLIMMGTHGWSRFDRVLMGSVAERVISQAHCPVLAVRSEEKNDQTVLNRSKGAMDKDEIATPRHLLLSVDFSDCSLDAFEYATQLAKWLDASVTLLHAVEPLSYSLDFNLTHPIEDKHLRQKVEARLSELTEILKKEGIRANYQLGDKPAADTIVKAIADTQADLVVMGTHGRLGLSRLIMGSLTALVLRRSSCPVLTVKSPKFKYDSSKN